MSTERMTYRQMADRCCEHCRALPGDGPWCCRCGAERPGVLSNGSAFTDDVCARCESELAQERL